MGAETLCALNSWAVLLLSEWCILSRFSEPRMACALALASGLGYQADLAGSLLRAARPRNIGLICRLDQELHFTYHNEILAEADERELHVIVQSIGGSLSAERAVRALNQLRCRAVIVVDPGSIDGVAGGPGAG